MESHITYGELQDLMEKFMDENPYGDSIELARFMYDAGFNVGLRKGFTETCGM